MDLKHEKPSPGLFRRRKTPSLTGMKMVTIEKIDRTYVARPHTVRQYRKRHVTFYNSTSNTVELDFSGALDEGKWPPFEENGPYILTGGALLTLRLKSSPTLRGEYPYAILEREHVHEPAVQEQADGEKDEPTTKAAEQYKTARMALRRGGNPQMIID